MAEQHLRQRHGRAAIASTVRRPPDETREIEYLCEIDLAEERMSGRLRGGRSIFDDSFEEEAEKAERTRVAPSPAADAKGASPPSKSRASSAPPASGPSTCCSHSPATRSRRWDSRAAVDVAGDRLRFEVEEGAAPELLRKRKEEGTPGPTGAPA